MAGRLGRIGRSSTIVAAAATILMIVCGTGSALGASFEPNEGLATATGPLLGASTYYAGIETPDDEDWFYFYVSRVQQMDLFIANTAASNSDCSLQAEVLTPQPRYAGSFLHPRPE